MMDTILRYAAIIISSVFLFGGCVMAESLVNADNLVNVTVNETKANDQLKLNVKAVLVNSSYCINEIKTEVQGKTLYIKVYEKFATLVPEEKRKGELDVTINVSNNLEQVCFWKSNKPIWKRIDP